MIDENQLTKLYLLLEERKDSGDTVCTIPILTMISIVETAMKFWEHVDTVRQLKATVEKQIEDMDCLLNMLFNDNLM